MALKPHKTTYVAVQTNGFWEIFVNSFGKPAPIGPRLAKKTPLPDYPTLATTEEEALCLVDKWTQWSKDTQPKRRKRRKR